MPDRLEIQKETELKTKVETIPWEKFIDFGSVKIQIRNGKPVLVTIEQTVKLD